MNFQSLKNLCLKVFYFFFVLKCTQREHVHNLNKKWALRLVVYTVGYNMRNFVSYKYFSVSGHIFNCLINIFSKIAYIYAIYSRFTLVPLFCIFCTLYIRWSHVNKHCTSITPYTCAVIVHTQNTLYQYILYCLHLCISYMVQLLFMQI